MTGSNLAVKTRVRPIENRDVTLLLDFLYEGDRDELREIGADVDNLPPRSAVEEMLRARVTAGGKNHLVIESDGRTVGYVAVPDICEGVGHVHAYIFNKSDRNKGIGRSVFLVALKLIFTELDLKTIVLEPKTTNVAMNGLIQCFGFCPVKTYKTKPSAMALEIEVNRYEIGRDELVRE
jgi:RimJ/RimL family protein N-acetyltransferase